MKKKRKQYVFTETGEVRPILKGEWEIRWYDDENPEFHCWGFSSNTGEPKHIYRLETREVEVGEGETQ